jgi:hypothetical protein
VDLALHPTDDPDRFTESDWDAWNARSLAEEPIVRLILDGTVVRVRLDRKATSVPAWTARRWDVTTASMTLNGTLGISR